MKKWMLFRLEARPVYYFWKGDYPILVQFPPDITSTDSDWLLSQGFNTMPSDEITTLDIMINNKSRVFTFKTRPKMRYIVVARGIFGDE